MWIMLAATLTLLGGCIGVVEDPDEAEVDAIEAEIENGDAFIDTAHILTCRTDTGGCNTGGQCHDWQDRVGVCTMTAGICKCETSQQWSVAE